MLAGLLQKISALHRFRIVAAILLLSLMALVACEPPLVLALRHTLFDSYQRLFPRVPTTQPAMIVAIDDKSLAAFGQWPWPRTRVAQLIDSMQSYQPAAMGIDVLFLEPDSHSGAAFASQQAGLPPDVIEQLRALPSGDSKLATALARGNTILGMAPDANADAATSRMPRLAPVRISAAALQGIPRLKGVLTSVPEINDAASGRAMLTGDEEDGIIRRVPVIARLGRPDATGTISEPIVLSLGLEMFRLALGSAVRVHQRDGDGLLVTLGELTLPVATDGRVWMRYSKHDDGRFVSAVDVANRTVPREVLESKMLLLGITGTGTVDIKTTALRERVPGVEIHAQLIEQLIASDHLERPDAALGLEVLAMLVAGALLLWWIPKLRVHLVLLIFVGLCGAFAGAGIGLFLWKGLLFDVAWPALSSTAILGAMLAASLAVSERQRRGMSEQAARMSGELMAAQRIQMGLLPDPRVVFRHETRFQLAATLEPARGVGGDFYDCFMVGKDQLFFVVADVSGKGLAAALFMASAKSNIKSAVLQKPNDVSGALTDAQIALSRENPEQMFVTVFAGILDVSSGRLAYVNAGHDAPYVRPPNGAVARLAAAMGPPLCVIDDFAYQPEKYQMTAGEWLFTETDGVTEATNPRGEFFGTTRPETLLAGIDANSAPAAIVSAMIGFVHDFAEGAEPADDITVMALRWNGETTATPAGGN